MTHTPFGLLVRTFVDGFFESDLLPDTVDPKRALAGAFAVIVTPTLWMSSLPIGASHRHRVVWEMAVERGTTAQIQAQIEVAYWGIQLLFAAYVMVVVAFVAFLVWDRLLPEQRDLMVLGTLPISDYTVRAAKLTALAIAVGGVILAIGVPSSLSMAVGARVSDVSWMPLRYLVAHLAVMSTAGLFVFCSVTALQTALGLFLERRLLRSLSVLSQLGCVVIAFETLVFAVPMSRWLADNALRLAADPVGLWLPPVWFLGLYETILGTDHIVFRDAAPIALLAVAASVTAVILAYVAGYRRVTQRVLESTERRIGARGWMTRLGSGLIYRVLIRQPARQAVTAFVVASVMRNQRYKLLLALYVGVGLSFVVGSVLFAVRDGGELLVATPTVLLLSAPLLLSFFALVGLRVLFTVPTELRANWIFQISESDHTASYVGGARAAMVVLVFPPLVLATLPVYWWLWGPVLGLGHTVFWVTLGLLLVELLLIRLHRIPFTCSYVPGKANVKGLWWLYLLVVIAYAYWTARVETWLLGDATRWTVGVVVLAGAAVAARVSRERLDRPTDSLRFNEEAAPAVQTLHLMPPV